MWAFASRRLRRWLLITVGLPAAAWALDRLGERLEARGGPSSLSRAARRGSSFLHDSGRKGHSGGGASAQEPGSKPPAS